jgi:hypothetical protein
MLCLDMKSCSVYRNATWAQKRCKLNTKSSWPDCSICENAVPLKQMAQTMQPCPHLMHIAC